MAEPDTSALQPNPGAWLWEVPGKPVSIHISLDVVDRMLQEVMRGFGAVPRRGAEVGGILLGKSSQDSKLMVEIDDFELVPIEYRCGPSYLFSDADTAKFSAALERNRKNAVGFFRSHTRDAGGLVAEDLALLDRFFPEPDKVALLIRPFATRVSKAGFFFRENGAFQTGPTLLEFNFRPQDLGAPPPSRRSRSFEEAQVEKTPGLEEPPGPSREFKTLPATSPVARPGVQGGWLWLPVSFIFLLLGVLLGFQAALTFRPQPKTPDPYAFSLAVSRQGENLSVRWDRQSPAIRAARQGVLTIDDNGNTRNVVLTAEQLQTGTVLYPHTSGIVKFTLDLEMPQYDILTETKHWKD